MVLQMGRVSTYRPNFLEIFGEAPPPSQTFANRHELEWKREECFLLRKPDPPVIVSVTKEASGRLKTTTVQILDYNLNR